MGPPTRATDRQHLTSKLASRSSPIEPMDAQRLLTPIPDMLVKESEPRAELRAEPRVEPAREEREESERNERPLDT